jgi:acetyl esterase/lipase
MSIANVDSELQPYLEAFGAMTLDFSSSGLQQMRDGVRSMLDSVSLRRPASVLVEDVRASGPTGDPEVVLRIYRPRSSLASVPILYWMHGGGMVMGSFDMDDDLLVGVAEQLAVGVVSVDYRLAPEHPDPAPVEDCYAGLAWTAANAADYGLDPQRIAVGGVSAGGGLAAGTALLARDRGGPPLRFQLLLEPMLDDRGITNSSTAYVGSVVWDRDDNRFGWTALLGTRVGTNDVSTYAAPARATDLTGLPPAWVDVGEIETFRDECISYAQNLLSAGVSTELHVYPGAFHGFDLIARDSMVGRKAWRLRWTALARALGVPPPAEAGWNSRS